MKTLLMIGLLITSAVVTLAQGTIFWNEGVDGPLSNSPENPTFLGSMGYGTNSVIGAAEFVPTGPGPGGVLYSDFITFAVNNDTQISDIHLQGNTPVAIWIGNPGFSAEITSIISPANGSLFPQLGLQSLQWGNYGLYVANWQFGSLPSIANYRLDFFVQAVPEPSAFSLLLVGAGFVGLRCWKRCKLRTK